MNPQLNKKVKKFLDDYLRDDKKNSPEHQHSVMLILKGALTDANFHSEAKQLDKFFPKAKNSELVGTKMEDVIESKGASIAAAAKYDGHDIIDAFAFYLNMSIGGGFGNKLNSLKESLEESLVSEGERLDEKNCPTNPSKWSYYKSQAKKKFDVYPSAYANGWASKQYKAAGGGWKQCAGESVNEELRPDEVEFVANKLGNSMPNHTNYDFDKGPDAKQVLIALKKYHKDFFRHSTNKQKQEIVKLVQKITTESLNESKEEVTPQQLSKIQSDIRKINSKIKVYISKHPITKGELSIELGAGHNDDSEIQKIYKVLKKHTGDWRTGTMFNESVNEAASRTAMEIGGLTGVNKDAIQKFVDDNKLDIEKLYQFVKKGKLADRMKLVSAIAGKPNNPVQKKMVKQFGESVNESQLKEFKHKVGSETIQFKVSPYRTGISLIAASGNDLDKLQDVMGSEDEVKGEIRKSLEKKLRIPIEIDRGYEGAGFGFKIDLYSLAKMVK